LQGFFALYHKETKDSSNDLCLLPSLLALYDALNDDDEEIREAAADVVSRILGFSLVPLAACAALLQWLLRHYGQTDAFCNIVLLRVTDQHFLPGSGLQSVETPLAAAMLDDDSLFVEEEQNLYIDEVRETHAWTSLLINAEGSIWDEAVNRLSPWALEGLRSLSRLAEAEDGPYGWTSKPRVFAICMRVVLAAKAITTRHDMKQETGNVSEDVRDLRLAMKRLHDVGSVHELHPVLLEELGTRENS
jgi:hypothetical protein